MDYRKTTEQYYSQWLGMADFISDGGEPVVLIESPERNKAQPGYSTRVDLYALFLGERIFVSYGDRAAGQIELLKKKLPLTPEAFGETAFELYGRRAARSIKFCYDRPGKDNAHTAAKTLDERDYASYSAFFKETHPSCKETAWLKGYFDEMVQRRACCGVFDHDVLVSCTDAPAMPYLPEKVQEIGINTLSGWRGKGYAYAACRLCAENIVASGKCPLWSCSFGHIASIRLAKKLGFSEYAQTLTITI